MTRPCYVLGLSGLHDSMNFKRRYFPHLEARAYRMVQGLDSAAALASDAHGTIAAAAEERFCRDKGTGRFPLLATQYCLAEAGIDLSRVDHLAHCFAYEEWADSFAHSALLRLRYEEIYSREAQLETLREQLRATDLAERFVQVPHHLAHAASAYYPSGFEQSLVLVVDGMGEHHSLSVALGTPDGLHILRQVSEAHSLGLLYGLFTHYLGFWFNLDEYKVMGLAPYGNSRNYFTKVSELIALKPDGTLTIPVLSANRTDEERETYAGTLRRLSELFGPPRTPGAPITQHHRDIAASLQAVLEMSLLHVLRHFKKETGQENLCLAGGVALNCAANGVIRRSRLFKGFFVQPASGDDGAALGAALHTLHARRPAAKPVPLALPLLGPGYSDAEILAALKDFPSHEVETFDSPEALVPEVARRIREGAIVGWFQGRMEFGPRALGSRSILADPTVPDMRERVNALIKKREDFRPFAPAVIEEAAHEIFELNLGEERAFAHMLMVTNVQTQFRERLPAVTHVNGSARVQTVSRSTHPLFWTLIQAFGQHSGVPVLLNTSFNVRGQPIVNTPAEALETLSLASLDGLAMGRYWITRRQPASGDESNGQVA